MTRSALALLSAASLLFVACGGDDGGASSADPTSAPTTDVSTDAPVTTDGAESPTTDAVADTTAPDDDGGSTGGVDLCAALPADAVAATLGAEVAESRPMTVAERTNTTDPDSPSCTWFRPDGFAVLSAEEITSDRYATVIGDTSLGLQPLGGVGDEAFMRPDLIDPTKALDAYVTAGGRSWAITFFSAATVDQATSIATSVIAA